MSRQDPIASAKEVFDLAGKCLTRYEQMTTPAGRASEMAGFDVAIRTAHVAATIALAEEQRTANLIAWHGYRDDGLRATIEERLGLAPEPKEEPKPARFRHPGSAQ